MSDYGTNDAWILSALLLAARISCFVVPSADLPLIAFQWQSPVTRNVILSITSKRRLLVWRFRSGHRSGGHHDLADEVATEGQGDEMSLWKDHLVVFVARFTTRVGYI